MALKGRPLWLFRSGTRVQMLSLLCVVNKVGLFKTLYSYLSSQIKGIPKVARSSKLHIITACYSKNLKVKYIASVRLVAAKAVKKNTMKTIKQQQSKGHKSNFFSTNYCNQVKS